MPVLPGPHIRGGEPGDQADLPLGPWGPGRRSRVRILPFLQWVADPHPLPGGPIRRVRGARSTPGEARAPDPQPGVPPGEAAASGRQSSDARRQGADICPGPCTRPGHAHEDRFGGDRWRIAPNTPANGPAACTLYPGRGRGGGRLLSPAPAVTPVRPDGQGAPGRRARPEGGVGDRGLTPLPPSRATGQGGRPRGWPRTEATRVPR